MLKKGASLDIDAALELEYRIGVFIVINIERI